MFTETGVETALILIIMILTCVFLFMKSQKVKTKYYVVGFFVVIISFVVFVSDTDTHSNVWYKRTLHYFGIQKK
jgi:hypothetical protein